MATKSKPILCVDFDGVIHSYISGWKGADVIPDPPVPGALSWLRRALEFWTICVYSSRSASEAGRDAMKMWFHFWEDEFSEAEEILQDGTLAEDLTFSAEKPAALLTIDDRAIPFEGSWDLLDPRALLSFRPWNKRKPGTSGLYELEQQGGVVTMRFGWPVTSLSWSTAAARDLARKILSITEEKS